MWNIRRWPIKGEIKSHARRMKSREAAPPCLALHSDCWCIAKRVSLRNQRGTDGDGILIHLCSPHFIRFGMSLTWGMLHQNQKIACSPRITSFLFSKKAQASFVEALGIFPVAPMTTIGDLESFSQLLRSWIRSIDKFNNLQWSSGWKAPAPRAGCNQHFGPASTARSEVCCNTGSPVQ